MNEIRVGRVGWHSCIRGYKQALALKQYGVKTHWLCHKVMPTHYSFHHFETINCFQIGDGETAPKAPQAFDQFRRSIEHMATFCDVFHIDNEPNWFVEEMRKVTDKPIVFDLHDLTSEREFIVQDDERSAFAKCDAIITQSPNYSRVSSALRPDLAEAGLIDHCYCAVPRALWPDLSMRLVSNGTQKLGGITYEGGISESLTGGSEFRYRWWLPFMEPLTKDNINVYVYAAAPGQYADYRKAGVRITTTLPFKDMLQHLTLHDWGVLGNVVNHPAFDNAMPNKLFEYTAAELPVIVYNAKQAAELVLSEGIGVVVNRPEDVKHIFSSAGDFLPAVRRFKEKYCMDNEVKKVLAIYNKLVG